MAVPAGPTEKRYTGNGVTTIFTIPFLLLAASDLDVFLDGVEIVSGFTITGVGNPTSTITFTTAPPSLSSILLSLNVPFERLNDYQENGDFLSSTVNRDFDRIWQALKQLFRYSTRALTLGFFDVDGSGAYRAKGNKISDLADPVSLQDAVTKNWVTLLLDGVSGAVNTTTGILYDAGTLFDHLRFGVARTVDSISALRLLSSARNQRAFVLGYYAKGDGGGGAYFVDVGDTTSVDNGGTIIVAADGSRWKLQVTDAVSIKQFGAVGDGVTHDHAYINAALAASLNVFAPPGTYLLGQTLYGRPRARLWGSIAESTQFKRDGTDYGDTLVIGEESSSVAVHANMVHISGIWFYREFQYTPGVTTSIPDPLSASTAHIRMFGGQNAIIEDCMIWNTPILIDVVSSSLVTIRKNGFHSMICDNRNSALQEGFAAILLRNSPLMSGSTQLVELIGNHINGGYFSAPRSVTTGSVTTSMVECIGAQYGVYVTACEGLFICGGYLGAFNQNNIYLNATNLITNVKIIGAFIDGSRDYAVAFNSTNGNPTVGVQITGCDFNMQLINLGAIYAIGAGWPTVTKLIISACNIENSIQTPILLFSAVGVDISHNEISAYNVKRGGDANSLYAAGVLVGGVSERVHAMGNSYGGNVNDLGGSNGCRWGIYFDGVGYGYANDERDLGRSLAAGTPLVFGGMASPASPTQAVHNAATGNFQVLPSHSAYLRTGTATTATVAALPLLPATGQEIIFKDQSNASAFPIIIQDVVSGLTIDGAANLNITTTNGFVKLRFNGTQWNRIG